MSCLSCRSSNQAEFPSEMLIHLGGLKNLTNPGLAVPDSVSLLDCA
jgi:hypothetical protein